MPLTEKSPFMGMMAVLAYLALLVLLLALLFREMKFEKPPFTLAQNAVAMDRTSRSFSLNGKNFDPGIRGLAARKMVGEEHQVWSQLTDLPVRGAAIADNLMLASCDKGKIISFEFNRGEPPRILGSLQMPSTSMQLAIVNKRAVIALQRHDGLALVDLTDPTEMRTLSYLPESGLPAEMVVVGNQVYYADLYAGIKKIDLSSDHPVVEEMAKLDSPWKIARRGQKLVVGTLKGEVDLYEITPSGRLDEIGSMKYPDNIVGVAFSGQTLVVAVKGRALDVYKLSSWPKLADPVRIKLPGKPLGLEAVPGEASVVANLVPNGLAVIDLSDPSAPEISGYQRTARIYQEVVAHANTVVGMSYKGLEAFSLEKIKGREPVNADFDDSSYQLLSWNGQVLGFDGEAVVALNGGVSAGHIANPLPLVAHNKEINVFIQREDGTFLQAGAPLQVDAAESAAFHDGFLYVLHRKGLRVFNGEHPGELDVVADLPLPGIPQAFQFLATGQVLVAARDEGLLVVDVKNPHQPRLVADLPPLRHLHSSSVATDLLVDGRKAYIAYGLGGVQVVDISVPEEPKLLQIINTRGYAKKLLLNDGVLLVADGTEGIFLIDTQGDQGAVPIGSTSAPFRIDEMAQAQGQLVISSHSGGTMKTPMPQRLDDVDAVSAEELSVGFGAEPAHYDLFLYDGQTSAKVTVTVQ